MQHQVSPSPVRKVRSSVVLRVHGDISNATLVGETHGHELYLLKTKGEPA